MQRNSVTDRDEDQRYRRQREPSGRFVEEDYGGGRPSRYGREDNERPWGQGQSNQDTDWSHRGEQDRFQHRYEEERGQGPIEYGRYDESRARGGREGQRDWDRQGQRRYDREDYGSNQPPRYVEEDYDEPGREYQERGERESSSRGEYGGEQYREHESLESQRYNRPSNRRIGSSAGWDDNRGQERHRDQRGHFTSGDYGDQTYRPADEAEGEDYEYSEPRGRRQQSSSNWDDEDERGQHNQRGLHDQHNQRGQHDERGQRGQGSGDRDEHGRFTSQHQERSAASRGGRSGPERRSSSSSSTSHRRGSQGPSSRQGSSHSRRSSRQHA